MSALKELIVDHTDSEQKKHHSQSPVVLKHLKSVVVEKVEKRKLPLELLYHSKFRLIPTSDRCRR